MVNLIKSEFELFAFFDLTPDLVCIAGKDGFFKKVNPAVIDKLGYAEAELFDKPVAFFIHPEDKDLTQKSRVELLNGKVLHNFINRYVTKKGAIIWLEWTSLYFDKQEIVFAIAKDVTERKQKEKEVEAEFKKLKGLATHFKSNIEKDRKYLTYELHEELAQLVFGLKMDVEMIAGYVTDLPEAAKSTIEHATVVSGMLIKTLQRISFSISPVMLDDFGLNATLEWLSEEFSIINGIPCSFNSNIEEEILTHEIKLDFFRICQESLTNIVEHAKAGNVKISIELINDKIELTIKDDGIGFDTTQQKKTPGLLSMRERAASINGRLTVQSEPGKGTTISTTLILQENEMN